MIGIVIWIAFHKKRFNKYDEFGIYKQLLNASILFFGYEIISTPFNAIGVLWFWDNEFFWIGYYYWETLWFFLLVYIEVPAIERIRSRSTLLALKLTDDHELSTVQWVNIVENGFGYTSFMEHLRGEFSLENLLFITEYIQLKNILATYYPDIISTIKSTSGHGYFYVNLPFKFNNDVKNNSNSNNKNNNKKNNNSRNIIKVRSTSRLPKKKTTLSLVMSRTATSSQNDSGTDAPYETDDDGHDHDTEREIVTDHDHEMELVSVHSETSVQSSHSNTNQNETLKEINGVNGASSKKRDQITAVEIPQSLIVQTFIAQNRTNKDSVNGQFDFSSDEDVKSIGGEAIINAFKALYLKYIDSQEATLMINIGDRERKQLRHELNRSHYLAQSLKDDMGSNDISKFSCFVEKEWYDNDCSLSWLMNELITGMDKAAQEIRVLMNDSFIRFRSANRELVAKLYHKSQKSSKNQG